MDFAAIAELCAPGVASDTLKSIASVESSFNRFAIGVVGGRLERQPSNLAEALATATMLEDQGYDYSLGLVQVNQKNFAKYGLTPETAFDPCANLRVGSQIFLDCYKRAGASANAMGDALSCYYSGNFTTGYRHGYVAKVIAAGGSKNDVGGLPGIPVVKTSARSKARPPVQRPRQTVELLFITTVEPPVDPGSPGAKVPPQPMSKETALLF